MHTLNSSMRIQVEIEAIDGSNAQIHTSSGLHISISIRILRICWEQSCMMHFLYNDDGDRRVVLWTQFMTCLDHH